MLTQKKFQIGTVALNYVEGPPSGPPLLLLHGITQRWQEFLPIIPALVDRYQVYALDFRGHGKSGRALGTYIGETYSQDVLEFIDNVIAEPCLIFGHSLGGMVSLYLSANYPSRFRAQILGDCIVYGTAMTGTALPSVFGKVFDLIAGGKSYERLRCEIPEMCVESPIFGSIPFRMLPGCDEPYCSAWARALSQLDPDVLKMTLDGRAIGRWNPDDLIARIECPTLLLQADPKLGGLMTDEDVSRIKANCPEAQLARLSGIGHPLHMHDPAPVLRALLNFLAALDE